MPIIQEANPMEVGAGILGGAIQQQRENKKYADQLALQKAAADEQKAEFQRQLDEQIKRDNEAAAQDKFNNNLNTGYANIAKNTADDQHKAFLVNLAATRAENDFNRMMHPLLIKQAAGNLKGTELANAATQVQNEIAKKYGPIMAQLGVDQAHQNLWLGSLSGRYTEAQIGALQKQTAALGAGGSDPLAGMSLKQIQALKPEEAMARMSTRAQNVVLAMQQSGMDPLKAEQSVQSDPSFTPSDKLLAPLIIGSTQFKAPAAAKVDPMVKDTLTNLHKSLRWNGLTPGAQTYIDTMVSKYGLAVFSDPNPPPEFTQGAQGLTTVDMQKIKELLGIGG